MKNRLILCLVLLPVFPVTAHAAGPAFQEIACEGDYQHHLQGVCASDDALFWCFTSELVKTELDGRAIKKIPVPGHHGDLCYHDGKVYVATNLGKFNRAPGEANSWIYIYRADDLALVTRIAVPEAVHGAGGIAYHDGRFLVVGGLPKDVEENSVFEYDADCKFVQRHTLKSGYTLLGIQTVAYADGHWWFGCYGNTLLKADESLQNVERFEFDCATGIVPVAKNQFLTARGSRTKEGRYTSRLLPAIANPKTGLARNE